MTQSVVDLFQQLARNEFGFFSRLQRVSELMTTSIPVVNSDCSLGHAIDHRDPQTIGSLAVVDSTKGDLIGVLRHSTILRCLPRYLNTLKEGDRDRSVLTANVCDLVTRRSPTVSPSSSPLAALEIMVRQNCDWLLVCDSPDQLCGVLTPLSFARTMLLYYQVYQQLQPLQRLRLVDLDSDLSLDEIFCRGAQTARDVMNAPVSIDSREPVAMAIQTMLECHVEHLPLLDENQRVTGIVSRNDVLLALQPPARPHLLDTTVPLPTVDELLAAGQENVLSEPVTGVGRSRLISVSPTSRLSETLSRLVETGRDAVVVQDDQNLLGIVTLRDIVRVFRTLMRLQALKDR